MNLDTREWTDKLGFHYDFEFMDIGTSGLETISIGGIFESCGIRGDFYGINSDYFSSKTSWPTFVNHTNPNYEFMHDNVFKQILVEDRASSKRLSMSDLLDNAVHGDEKYISRVINLEPVAFRILSRQPFFEDQVVIGSPEYIGNKLDAMAVELGATKERPVQPIGYYPAHDHVCLNNLFGGMLKTPEHWNYFSLDLRSMTDLFCQDHDDYNPETPHHCYADACGQRDTWLKLADYVYYSGESDAIASAAIDD